MIEIYICDDNEEQLSLYEKFINDTILIEDLDMKIVKVSSDPHSILELALSSDKTGLFFLDIGLESDINGLILAQRIRKIQPQCFIIFITSHSEMSLLTFQYKVEALDFIIKHTANHVKTRIHECLLDVNEKHTLVNNKINKAYIINQNDKIISTDYDDILYFETSPNVHKVILHTPKRITEFTGQLKDVEQQLDNRFYRCHRSFIVNKDKISRIDFNELTVYMNSGDTCLISVRKKRGLRKLLS